MKGGALLIGLLMALTGWGQLDTIRMASIGGEAEDGGLAVAAINGGDALIVGYTDSNGWGTRVPWALRVDSVLNVVWQRALPVDAGGVALGAVVLPDGTSVLASRELLAGAAGYGVRWHHVDTGSGELLGQTAFATGTWLLPQGLSLQGDTLVTWVTDFASGTAQPAALLSTWSGEAWNVVGERHWGTPGLTEELAAGVITADRWWIASTERPTMDSARVRVRCTDAEAQVHWSALAPIDEVQVEANAMSVVDTMVVVGMTVDEQGPSPLARVVRWDTSGTTPPFVIAPSNPAQVRAVRWNPPQLQYLFRTEVFGLGQGDMIYVRQGPLGGFIGAMSFGWEEAEEPEAMMEDGLGAVWLVGSTDHENPNVHVVRAPSDQIGDHHLVTSTTVLPGSLSLHEPGPDPRIAAFPNPSRAQVTLSGLPCPASAAHFVAFTLRGTILATGRADQLDVSSWPSGTYLIDVRCGTSHYSLRLVRS